MKNIFKFSEFINEKVVGIPTIIEDFIKFLEESPVVVLYPEDKGDDVRQGWVSKEHKMYSMAGIKKYLKNKYGNDYGGTNVSNAIQFDPNLKILNKKLSERGMTLQMTPVKGMYGDTTWFYSVNLSDSEREKIKSELNQEFLKRSDLHFKRQEAAKSKKVVEKKPTRKRVKKNESLEFLIEGLIQIYKGI